MHKLQAKRNACRHYEKKETKKEENKREENYQKKMIFAF